MHPDRRVVATQFEVRATPTGGALVVGHGAVFNSLSRNLGGWVEEIATSAFDKTLADDPDVRALINHDPMAILGRTRSGTLRLSKDSTGLAYEIDMPDRQDARDLLVSLERGDITQSSFAFFPVPEGSEWSYTDQGMPLRTLTAVSIHNGDVSPVTYPAYEAADSGVASRALSGLAVSRGVPLDEVLSAAARGELSAVVDLPTADPAGRSAQRATHADLTTVRARLHLPAQRATHADPPDTSTSRKDES